MVVPTPLFRPCLILALIPVLFSIGCVRRDGRNADCRWPAETTAQQPTQQHLSADAEFAEELAIRYADVHHGLRTPFYISGEDYVANRDRCMASLFGEVAEQHNVPVETVAASLGRNRGYVDLAINVPFALLCCVVAFLVATMIWRRYPPNENGWIPGTLMSLFLSLAFALVAPTVGDIWARFMETYRIGNDHLSLRTDRLPWMRHRFALSVAALIVFLLSSLEAARRLRSQHIQTVSLARRSSDGWNID